MGMGLLALTAVGLSYYFVKNMNSESKETDFAEIDKHDWILKKYAKIYGVSWRILKAHIGTATEYGLSQMYKSKIPWGQDRLGIMGMRGIDFDYVQSVIKTNLQKEDRVSEMVSIEFGAAFLKFVNAKYTDHNSQVIAFYLGLEKEPLAETGDIYSDVQYLAKFNTEYAKILQRQKE